ncbi:hypothetical protein CEXT_20761 [Caerostris extrusa]|uniref:Uncharacterized protein n=1 Tax=Caerostris extrusa TaxID=172846 RepID=A0AAV4QVG6_CAEEX|nr:hypothetical protein CEXT_20761 [Caerostris extrusa]
MLSLSAFAQKTDVSEINIEFIPSFPSACDGDPEIKQNCRSSPNLERYLVAISAFSCLMTRLSSRTMFSCQSILTSEWMAAGMLMSGDLQSKWKVMINNF